MAYYIDTTGNVGGQFTDGVPGAQASTIVNDEWLNMVQGEITYCVNSASIVLQKGNNTQLWEAIQFAANSVGNRLSGYLPLTGGTLTGDLTIQSGADGNHLRLVGSSYGLIQRQENSSFNMLTTEANDPEGAYNANRPLAIDLATGNVTLGEAVTVGKSLAVNGQTTIAYNLARFDGNAFASHLILTGDQGIAGTGITFCVPNTGQQNYNAYKIGNQYSPTGGTVFLIASYADSDPTGAHQANITGTLSMDQAGNVMVSGALTQGSDRTEKENIVEAADEYLSAIRTLHTYRYNRIGQTRHEVGIMAQDVQAAIPEAVIVDANGKLRVDALCLISTLMSAVRELAAKVDALTPEAA